MARYIDADAAIKLIEIDAFLQFGYSKRDAIDCIKAMPTEDVAPKSEVAREIFAEIEFEIHQLDFDREETRAIAIEGIIANAKKKYTEGETNGCKQ